MRNVLIVCMNSTEERSGGGNGAMQCSRCFYETFKGDRIFYFGPKSAYWKERAHHYREIGRSRRDDVLARARLRTNFVCVHIDRLLAEIDTDFDLVLLNNSRLGYTAQAVRPRTRYLLTYYANVEIDYIRHKYASPLLTAMDGAIFRWRERQCARLSDASLFITQRDVRRHAEVYGPTRYAMLPVATDAKHVQKKPASELRLAFLGSFSYKPNVEAARYIIDNILSRTGHRLLLAGSDPPRELIAWVERHRDRIDFHPNFATLNGLISERDVLVSPLASGAGMKVKVADAIAMAMPILGSDETFVGYEDLPHVEYLTCRTPEDYVTKVRELGDAPRYADMCRDLHAAWKERYSMEASIAVFKAAYASLERA